MHLKNCFKITLMFKESVYLTEELGWGSCNFPKLKPIIIPRQQYIKVHRDIKYSQI